MLEAMALRSAIGGVSLGAMIAISVTQGRRLFFLCRRFGLLPKPEPAETGAQSWREAHDHPVRRSRRDARRRRERRRQGQAIAHIHRGAHHDPVGRRNLARDALIALAPAWFGPRWFFIDAIGVIGTLALLRWVVEPGARFPLRTLAAFCLFYAFGWIWANFLGGFGPREQMAFWPTLFLFGYALAGLWFGPAFSAIGLGLTALILAGYCGRAQRSRCGSRRFPAADSSSAASGCGGPERWTLRTTLSTSRSACA